MSRKPATRRQSSPPPTDPPPSAEGDTSADSAEVFEGDGCADSAQPSTPAPPVQRIRIKKPPLLRAGGHVLTERGWQPVTQDEEK